MSGKCPDPSILLCSLRCALFVGSRVFFIIWFRVASALATGRPARACGTVWDSFAEIVHVSTSLLPVVCVLGREKGNARNPLPRFVLPGVEQPRVWCTFSHALLSISSRWLERKTIINTICWPGWMDRMVFECVRDSTQLCEIVFQKVISFLGWMIFFCSL